MLLDKSEKIHTESRTPKYMQVVNLIFGRYWKGEIENWRSNSIDQWNSLIFLLSRDTWRKLTMSFEIEVYYFRPWQGFYGELHQYGE